MSMKWSCQGLNPYNTVRPPYMYISLTHSYRTTEQYWYINPVFPLESVIMGFNIFSIILFLIASLLEPESSDPVSNGMVEQLQLIQPQFVDRYWSTSALLFIFLKLGKEFEESLKECLSFSNAQIQKMQGTEWLSWMWCWYDAGFLLEPLSLKSSSTCWLGGHHATSCKFWMHLQLIKLKKPYKIVHIDLYQLSLYLKLFSWSIFAV